MRLIRIVGDDDDARADAATALVEALGRRGLAVSVVSRTGTALALDRPGKDSHAHRMAGARDVAVISAARVAVIHEAPPGAAEPTLGDLLSRMQPADIVLALGFDEAQGDAVRLDGGYAEFAGVRFPLSEPDKLAEHLAPAP
ncbi:MAG: molybdopterin-guanine dinucleotide biosynthesis protein B [Alphaproteobacteria bacterium]